VIRELAGGTAHAGVVTRRADGVVVAAPDGRRFEGTLYVRGPYPVGSGDAFLAGLVASLERDPDWPTALRLALGAATANAGPPQVATSPVSSRLDALTPWATASADPSGGPTARPVSGSKK
jgi:sugar/nucleoside kinase (ribokinase family)